MSTSIRSNPDGSSTLLVGGTAALNISAAGIVTFPNQKVGFRSIAQNKTVAGDGTLTDVIGYDTPSFNDGNFFNVSTGRFSPNVPGYYQLNAMAGFNTTITGTSIAVHLRLNGATSSIQANTPTNPASFPRMACGTILFLNGTSDYVILSVSQNSGGSKTDCFAYFSAYLIQPA